MLALSTSNQQPSLSLPGSPYMRRNSRGSQYSWRRPMVPSSVATGDGHGVRGASTKGRGGHGIHTDRQPLVHHTLENLPLPFADDSGAVTPSSEDLCNFNFIRNMPNGRRFSFASQHRRSGSQHAPQPGSRRSSFASNHSRASRTSRCSHQGDRSKMETLLNFKKGKNPDVVLDKSKLDDDVRMYSRLEDEVQLNLFLLF